MKKRNRFKEIIIYSAALWISLFIVPLIVISALIPMYPIAIWMMTKHIIARYKQWESDKYDKLI